MIVGMDHDDTLRSLVRAPWRHLRNAVDDLPDPAPDPALHAVRIRAKRARYAAEVVEPAFGKTSPGVRQGRHRWCRTCSASTRTRWWPAAWLRANALTLGDPAAVFVAGELGAVERAAAQASADEFPAVWRRARAQAPAVLVVSEAGNQPASRPKSFGLPAAS